MTVSVYSYATTYHKLGFSVIPLVGKKCSLRSWKYYQKRQPTLAKLKKWFFEKDQNIAIVTGRISNLLVLDIDSEEARQKAEELGLWVETPRVKTGKGWHLYFKYREGVRNFVGEGELKGLDVRSDGGYVVAPPSVHPETGATYRWEIPPNQVSFAELPELPFEKSSKKALAPLYEGVPEGQRNDSLAKLVGSWVRDGASLESCLRMALAWNSQNSPPLPESEVERTVRSIYERHRELADTTPFNFEVERIPFGLKVFEAQTQLHFQLKHLRYDAGDLRCHLVIRCGDGRAGLKLGFNANANLLSPRTTGDLRGAIKKLVPHLDEPLELIESFKQVVIESMRGDPPVPASAGAIGDFSPDFLLEPLLLKQNINLIFGEGGSGKSTLACYFATELSKRGFRTLYLDFENPTTVPIQKTINRISRHVEGIYIKCPRRRLVDCIDEIYENVRELDIDVVIVDSVAKSMLTDLSSVEAVSNYTTNLMQISEVTWLLISHVAKSNDSQPYGSIFFMNDARNVWLAKRVKNRDSLIVQLIHMKSNFTSLYPSKIFHVRDDEGGELLVEEKTLSNTKITELIVLTLGGQGPLSFAELSRALPSIAPNTLSRTLNRLKRAGRLVLEDKLWRFPDDEEEVATGVG